MNAFELSEQRSALFRMDLSSLLFFSQLEPSEIKSQPTTSQDCPNDMELDPTLNNDLHVYIWKKLTKRIEVEL
jgi:hypothetical protein